MVSRITKLFRRGHRDLDCDDVHDLGSDYVDEELDSDTREKVRLHIGWCGPCNAFLNTLRATVDILRSTPKQQAPSGFTDRVKANLSDGDGS